MVYIKLKFQYKKYFKFLEYVWYFKSSLCDLCMKIVRVINVKFIVNVFYDFRFKFIMIN